MKLDRLLEFTRQPKKLAEDESQDIETLLQEYPYFGAAQLLLTLKYKLQNSSRFNRQLQRAAAHLADKNVLASALDESLAQLQRLENLETAEEQLLSPHNLQPSETLEEASEADLEILQLNETEEFTVTNQTVIAEEEAPVESAAEVEVVTEVVSDVAPEQVDEVGEKDQLNTSTEEEIDKAETLVASTVELQTDEAAPTEIVKVPTPELVLVQETADLSAKPEEEAAVVNEVGATHIPNTDIHTFVAQEHDRLSWFRFYAGKPLREQSDDVLEELYLEHMSGDFLKAEAATLPELKSELKAVVNHNPEVAQNKNLEEEIRRLAYESISDEELPASETLAAIYESQKDYKKALRIYQKLMLKFPDRMTYFAGLIASTKEKLNN